MIDPIVPGLLVLHGNRLELLQDAVFAWIGRQPLAPLEQEIFLVQSNGIAEWLKMSLARHEGICAAVTMQLPARFVWRAYAQVLGRERVPSTSALDKAPLTWRLMRLLPAVLARPEFTALRGFLADGDPDRRLQLAQRLADLYDQYQVYRADWLEDWAAGRDQLRQAAGGVQPLSASQAWQAALWRAVLADIAVTGGDATGRVQVHTRFVQALTAGAAPAGVLPRRVILFGASTLPRQTLEALHALAHRCQVIVAIPNPCRFHWADIIDGRELLKAQRRQGLRQGRDLAQVPLEDLHAFANPLLAAWGRQGRDFIRLLDAFETPVGAAVTFSRVDLFTDEPGDTLLAQVQAHIRELEPLAAHGTRQPDPGDRSIVFHIAHSAQREVEILHDRLLELFAQAPADAALAPRDVVIMVPAIEDFAPAIRAVFGQYERSDARYIPFDIVDLRTRGFNPLLVALEWLLHLPQQRCRLSDIQNLLDVPSLARRFGLERGDVQRLAQWMAGAGVRWGLSSQHRRELGLHACGEQNSWLFGLRRMLLGYASGGGADFAGIEPYEEIGGLDASLAGSLAALVAMLERWERRLAHTLTPVQWGEAARGLLADCFTPADEAENLTLAALHTALHRWLDACDEAGFDEGVPLDVLREAWLGALDEPAVNQSFMARGVTFCTLMPMRAIPFEVVGLLGMNDADYPRRAQRVDFDLMALPGAMRPGDRSRRDDDRYLMLEALLSARRTLYVSWSGRSVRDNSVQPPSVLVAQLRDYLAAGWAEGMLERLTTEHPLQPFSARYFEGGGLVTYAREWRAAHRESDADMEAGTEASIEAGRHASMEASSHAGIEAGSHAVTEASSHAGIEAGSHAVTEASSHAGIEAGSHADTEADNHAGPDTPSAPRLTLAVLADFLTNPVRHYFRHQLDVVFDRQLDPVEDDECFALDGLDEHILVNELIEGMALRAPADPAALARELDARASAIERAGRLPLGAFGARAREQLTQSVLPIWQQWHRQLALWSAPGEKEPLRFAHGATVLDDWLDGLRLQGDARAWLEISPYRLYVKGALRGDKLLGAWLRQLVCSACGLSIEGIIVGRDALVTTRGLPREQALAILRDLLDAWWEGTQAPLPFACKTAFAAAQGERAGAQAYEGEFARDGEVAEPCLARTYPSFEALTTGSLTGGRDLHHYIARLFAPIDAWMASAVTVQVYAEDGEPADPPTATHAPAADNPPPPVKARTAKARCA